MWDGRNWEPSSYDHDSYYNGKPAAALAIRQAAGANALDTANAIKGQSWRR